MTAIYAALTKTFDQTHTLRKGGAELTYVTGEQVITRLNETLGVDGWGFEVLEHGQLGDDFWARGRLTAYFPERTVVREQFGGVTANRGMAPADTLKGAATDALKKCASLIGVALYLSDKDDPASHQPAPRPSAPARQAQASPSMKAGSSPESVTRAVDSAPAGGGYREPTEDEWTVFYDAVKEATGYTVADVCMLLGRSAADHLRALNEAGTPKTGKALKNDLIAHKREGRAIPGVVTQPAASEGSAAVKTLQDDLPTCAQCGAALQEMTFRDGTRWEIAQLRALSQRKHGKVLCMACYCEANAARLRQERAEAPASDPVTA